MEQKSAQLILYERRQWEYVCIGEEFSSKRRGCYSGLRLKVHISTIKPIEF